MFHLVSSRIEEVTFRRAEGFEKINTFEGQRPKSEDTIKHYAALMLSGGFGRGEIAIAELPDGSMILMNGQHQCAAAIRSKCTFKAAVDHYKCDTAEDAWLLFGSFDVHKSRTKTDVMRAARGLFNNPSLQSVQLRVLQKCGAALHYLGPDYQPDFGRKTANKTQEAALVEAHAMEVLSFSSFGDDVGRKIPTPVVAAYFAILKASPIKGQEFWERVFIGDQLKAGSPQFRLNKVVYDVSSLDVKGIGLATNGRRRAQILYNCCISWWNAYSRGEDGRRSVKLAAIKGTLVPDAA